MFCSPVWPTRQSDVSAGWVIYDLCARPRENHLENGAKWPDELEFIWRITMFLTQHSPTPSVFIPAPKFYWTAKINAVARARVWSAGTGGQAPRVALFSRRQTEAARLADALWADPPAAPTFSQHKIAGQREVRLKIKLTPTLAPGDREGPPMRIKYYVMWIFQLEKSKLINNIISSLKISLNLFSKIKLPPIIITYNVLVLI